MRRFGRAAAVPSRFRGNAQGSAATPKDPRQRSNHVGVRDQFRALVGAITFPLADFDIVAPNIGGFIISIADDGALEFLVRFMRG